MLPCYCCWVIVQVLKCKIQMYRVWKSCRVRCREKIYNNSWLFYRGYWIMKCVHNKSQGHKIVKHETCKVTSLFINLRALGKLPTQKLSTFFQLENELLSSQLQKKYNNQCIIAFTFLTMHFESNLILWPYLFTIVCPHTQEGKSLPHLRLTEKTTHPTLSGTQVSYFFYFVPIAINSTFKIPNRKVLIIPSFPLICSATKHLKTTVLTPIPTNRIFRRHDFPMEIYTAM